MFQPESPSEYASIKDIVDAYCVHDIDLSDMIASFNIYVKGCEERAFQRGWGENPCDKADILAKLDQLDKKVSKLDQLDKKISKLQSGVPKPTPPKRRRRTTPYIPTTYAKFVGMISRLCRIIHGWGEGSALSEQIHSIRALQFKPAMPVSSDEEQLPQERLGKWLALCVEEGLVDFQQDYTFGELVDAIGRRFTNRLVVSSLLWRVIPDDTKEAVSLLLSEL